MRFRAKEGNVIAGPGIWSLGDGLHEAHESIASALIHAGVAESVDPQDDAAARELNRTDFVRPETTARDRAAARRDPPQAVTHPDAKSVLPGEADKPGGPADKNQIVSKSDPANKPETTSLPGPGK